MAEKTEREGQTGEVPQREDSLATPGFYSVIPANVNNSANAISRNGLGKTE